MPRRRPNWLMIVCGAVALATAVVQLAPLIVVVLSSFTDRGYLSFPPHGFSLQWYGKIGDNPGFVTGLQTSLELAIMATLLVLVLGTPAAISIVGNRGRLTSALESFFLSPLLFPSVVFGLAYLALLSHAGGVPTFYAALIVHCVLITPYYIRNAITGLREMDASVIEASQSLGANYVRTLLRVTFPAIRGSVIAGCIFAFIISFDEPVVSLFLADVDFAPLPVAIFGYMQYSNDPTIAALASCLIGGALVAMLCINRLSDIRSQV